MRAVIAQCDPLYREMLRACGLTGAEKFIREIHLHWIPNEITTLEVHFAVQEEGVAEVVRKYMFVATELAVVDAGTNDDDNDPQLPLMLGPVALGRRH